MPKANPYIVPGRIYHLTHRCHDRKFLLRFAKDRAGYQRRLREAVLNTQVSLLTCGEAAPAAAVQHDD